MHLELHVGPLTAWFGPPLRAEALRAGESPPDEDAIRQRIEEWRAWVGEGLVAAGHLRSVPDWDEGDRTPPDRARLGADAVRALKLLVAHGENGAAPAALPAHPERDPAWIALAESGFADTPYPHVLVPEFWLPAEFDFTFLCPWPDGHQVQTGSVGALVEQLGHLREKLLGGTPVDVALWAQERPDTRDLRALARRAVGVLEQLGRAALARRQPMLWAPTDDS